MITSTYIKGEGLENEPLLLSDFVEDGVSRIRLLFILTGHLSCAQTCLNSPRSCLLSVNTAKWATGTGFNSLITILHSTVS